MGDHYRIEFTLMGLPSTPNSRRHWREVHKENEAWYSAVRAAAWSKRPATPLSKAKLTLTRVSATEPDYDNLCASFKPVIDGLRYAGVLLDDKKQNIGMADYFWEKCSPRKGCITICVEEVDS